MVKIEEVSDSESSSSFETEDSSPTPSELGDVDADASDLAVGLFSNDPSKESFRERLVNLQYMFPPGLISGVHSTFLWSSWFAKGVRSTTWVLSTSMILIAFPITLAIEGERMVALQEKEMNMQRGNQMLMPGQQEEQSSSSQSRGIVPPGF